MTNFLSQWRYCEINSLEILPQEQKLDHALQKAIRYDVRGIINGKILFVIEAAGNLCQSSKTDGVLCGAVVSRTENER